MTEEPDDADEFVANFHKFLGQVDEIAQLVLKGHLEIEAELDDVLKALFFHPEQLSDTRLSFLQKTQIARAQSIRGDKHIHWDVILAFNKLRNEIAHGRASERRTKCISELRKLLLEGAKPEFREEVAKSSEARVVVRATLVCTGFLLYFKDGLISLRRHIDELDAKLNPNKPRVPIQARIEEETEQ